MTEQEYTANDAPETLAAAAGRIIAHRRSIDRQLRDIKADYDEQNNQLRAEKASLELAVVELLRRHDRHAFTALDGEIRIGDAESTDTDDAALIDWCKTAAPQLLRHKAPTIAQLEALGTWADGHLVVDGEIVPGITRTTRPVGKISPKKRS